ncbi:MAG: InlB B-repeat-containing protein, partial [Bryobacteraceae bacterium]
MSLTRTNKPRSRYLAPITLLGLLAGSQALPAQVISAVRVSATHRLAKFLVDGQVYYGSATFLWPQGSKHILQFPVRDDNFQYADSESTRFTFSGWTDGNSLLQSGGGALTVTADPRVTQITANVAALHRTPVLFYGVYPPPPATPVAPANCGAPGDGPANEARVGVVIISGACLWNSAEMWLSEGTHSLNAFPYPGYVFEGWKVHGAATSFLTSFELRGPATIQAQFSAGKRVRFLTEPIGLNLLIDRTNTPTPIAQPCPNFQFLPPGAPKQSAPLCIGEFDWAMSSVHLLGAQSPQFTENNLMWVFHSFSNGLKENDTVKVTDLTQETIVGRFVPGARVGFVTNPTGLKLVIDGRDNWTSYNFAWAVGSKHTVSAVAEQTDSKSRRYRFKGWSNAAPAVQEITVPESAAIDGLRFIADYDVLSQVKIQSSVSGASLEVDGVECRMPCAVDRPAGTKVRISAPQTVPLSDVHRLEFVSWSDGGDAAHEITADGTEVKTITVNYRTAFRLALAADPAAGARFTIDPPSPDGFYPQGTAVTVSVDPLAGFRFRRWNGALEGTSRIGLLSMTTPRSARAMLDRGPFIAPAGIRNAAGETPDGLLAAGSLVTIFGENLAPGLEVGPTNPLAQVLSGVTVTVAGRILPLLFVSPQQINAWLPPDMEEGSYTLKVRWEGNEINGSFDVSRNAPGLFAAPDELKPEGFQASQSLALGFHDDGSPVSAAAPARRGRTTT